MRSIVPLVVLGLVSCDKRSESTPTTTTTTTTTATSSARPELSGNALAGMTKLGELSPLAKPGAQCQRCFFNGRCALLESGDAKLPCCDYADGAIAGAWKPGGGGSPGHAAECLSLLLDVPMSPDPSKGKLKALARPGQACKECSFDARCTIAEGAGNPLSPCCDYVRGKTAAAWADDDGLAARCLVAMAKP